MAPRTGTRAAQPGTSSGLGTHFSSPRKLRDKRKTQVLVEVPGQKAKQRQLLAKMASLLAGTEADTVVHEEDAHEAWEDILEPHDNCPLQPASQSTPTRRTQSDLTSTCLYNSWENLFLPWSRPS
ncbi:uncharacterized protein F5891DRAFT_1195936 [Suillus fuscotomentosus]|uniref:Uncharacterized protein n=1 Tax=Suillus fuscotomentosus TaxID=1912939 RepID=A0AAD4DU22_9AGAM|nr:uncharacterized protein F5891DRAFT_1195936 [Suillus fuscotomentosus]KAG1893799.1 hypothetical protein F5891DRAFT_1195936 [Suillus fuscotomentosus]